MSRLALLAVFAALAAGCGGARQDADEPSGTFRVEVLGASFPARQHIAEPVMLHLRVHNGAAQSLSNVAVTVQTDPRDGTAPEPFGQAAVGKDLADPGRPVWVLDAGPKDAQTADPATWDAGPLAPGESRDMTWRLVAVKAGDYTLRYRVFPGLTGRAKTAPGSHTHGTIHVTISDTPVPARIGADGQVVRGGGGGGT